MWKSIFVIYSHCSHWLKVVVQFKFDQSLKSSLWKVNSLPTFVPIVSLLSMSKSIDYRKIIDINPLEICDHKCRLVCKFNFFFKSNISSVSSSILFNIFVRRWEKSTTADWIFCYYRVSAAATIGLRQKQLQWRRHSFINIFRLKNKIKKEEV